MNTYPPVKDRMALRYSLFNKLKALSDP